MTPSGQAEKLSLESGRAADTILKCRTASGRAMKHRGTMILPAEGQELRWPGGTRGEVEFLWSRKPSAA